METEKKFFVYVDYRKDDGKPFYVGKGMEGRVKNLERNELHSRIKNKYGIIREVVFETRSEQEAFDKEVQLIQELQTFAYLGKGGANLTLGGEGGSGYKHTEEYKEMMSETSKKYWEDPEHKEKLSESVKKQWEDPERIEKMKKIMGDPDYKKKMSESLKKRWENPEHQEKVKKAKDDPEFKEKMSKSVKKRWENPEYRKNISEKVKLTWEVKRLEKLQQEA